MQGSTVIANAQLSGVADKKKRDKVKGATVGNYFGHMNTG